MTPLGQHGLLDPSRQLPGPFCSAVLAEPGDADGSVGPPAAARTIPCGAR